MKLSAATFALVLFVNLEPTVAFRVGSDGNSDLMKKAVEEALSVKPEITSSTGAPPLRNQILGTEVPVS